jgi:hypothetical protein
MAQPINQRTWRCWPVEDDPHRDLSGLDLWMVAVLQYLNPPHSRKAMVTLLLVASGHCFVHGSLRQ